MKVFQKLKISAIPQFFEKKCITGVFESSFYSTAIPEQMSTHVSLSAVTVLTSCIDNLNHHLSQI